jgi:hypothetical protein
MSSKENPVVRKNEKAFFPLAYRGMGRDFYPEPVRLMGRSICSWNGIGIAYTFLYQRLIESAEKEEGYETYYVCRDDNQFDTPGFTHNKRSKVE